MTKREAEMLAKNWRLGNRNRKKSLTKKYELKPATSGNTGRVKMGIRIDIENNPKDYRPALDDDGSLVFFTGKPMKRIQVSDLFVPPKARKENMINHKLEILKKTFPSEDTAILEQFLERYDFNVTEFSILTAKEQFKSFSERTQYQLLALKKDGTELKSNFYDDENELADMQQKCEDSDEYESTTVLKRIVDVDEDEEDDMDEYVVDNEEEEVEDEAVASIKDRPLVDPRDKAELYKLTTLALKQIPHSPKQKETIKKLNVLRKKNGMKPLKASTIPADMELAESYIVEFNIPSPDALLKMILKRFTKTGREELFKDRMKKALAPLDKGIEQIRDQLSDVQEALSDNTEAINDLGKVGRDTKLKRKKEQLVKKQEILKKKVLELKSNLRNVKEARRDAKEALIQRHGPKEEVESKDVHGEEGTDELTKKYKKVSHMESVDESAILDTIPKMVKGKEKKIATQFNALLRKKKNPKEIAKVFKQFSSKTKDEVMKVLAHSSVQDLLQRGQVVQQLAGMFDEVEKPKSRVDARQRDFREKLRKLGYAKKEKNYRTPYDTFNVFEEIEKTKKEDAVSRAKEKADLKKKHDAEIEREKEEIKAIGQDESFDGWRLNKHSIIEKNKKRFVKNIKSIKKNARSLPLTRDYILDVVNLTPLPMNNQMAKAKLSTNYDHPKYGSGTEIETKKGTVLIKPEVAELYIKSRDRLPDPIKKNMDKMAARSPDGLFTVLQAALNDLQTGMIESLTKAIK